MSENRRAKIISVGSAVPDNILTNKEIESFLNTSDEWIQTRTGIKSRHVFPKGEDGKAWELGLIAAKKALKNAMVSAGDVDCVICASFTPDYFFPSTACLIADKIGCKNAAAFDVSAACAGFVYGLSIANSFISSGKYKKILLIGSEVISKCLDWSDRTTCILFGDGAGAVLLEESRDRSGVLDTFLSSHGSLNDILYLPAWGNDRTMKMNGGEVFKNAVRLMADAVIKSLDKCGLSKDEIDLLIPHQANVRIMKSLAHKLGLPFSKVITNVERYGNTSSASIPIALEEAWNDGRIKGGDIIAFTSLGGGITIGSAIIRMQEK